LADVGARSHLKPMTVRRYAVKLRKMVADIAKVDAGVKGRAKRAKYDYMKGGRNAWLAKVDAQSLGLLTPDVVNAWRNHYVAKAGSDPVARKSAERSAASYLRCARSLFTPDVTSVLRVKLPANPFAGVKLKDPGPQRYHSEINPEWLLACARDELRQEQPQQYPALFLCLWAGLRRKEADLLPGHRSTSKTVLLISGARFISSPRRRRASATLIWPRKRSMCCVRSKREARRNLFWTVRNRIPPQPTITTAAIAFGATSTRGCAAKVCASKRRFTRCARKAARSSRQRTASRLPGSISATVISAPPHRITWTRKSGLR